MHTKQSLFDIAWKRANEMEKPAATWNEIAKRYFGCAYRSPNGPCLIGAAILDSNYYKEFEGAGVAVNTFIQEAAGIPESLVEFASSIQNCHDSNYNEEGFKTLMLIQLLGVAYDNALNAVDHGF